MDINIVFNHLIIILIVNLTLNDIKTNKQKGGNS